MGLSTTATLPAFDKLIRLHCHDWAPYRCIGRLVKYKKPPLGKKNIGWRFMMRDKDGLLESNQNAWKDAEFWEYVEEDAVP
jgi:hypothetical protein